MAMLTLTFRLRTLFFCIQFMADSSNYDYLFKVMWLLVIVELMVAHTL